MFSVIKIINNSKQYQRVFHISKFNEIFKISCVNYSGTKHVDLAYNTYENVNSKSTLPPLVIMHGLFGSKQNWRSICKAILQKTNFSRKIIAVDARNHGESPHSADHTYESMVEDVVELFRKENIKKAAILGHSMGGRTMMYLSLKYPELIEKGIFVDISPVSSSPSLYTMGPTFEAMTKVKLTTNITMSDARQQGHTQLKKFGIQDKSLRDFILTNLVQKQDGSYGWRINVDALHHNFQTHIAQFPSDAANLKYTGPVLFIGGGNSDYISENEIPEIRQLCFPTANLTVIDGAGHLVHAEKPAKFVEVLLQFLN